jgi:hypothetical protein
LERTRANRSSYLQGGIGPGHQDEWRVIFFVQSLKERFWSLQLHLSAYAVYISLVAMLIEVQQTETGVCIRQFVELSGFYFMDVSNRNSA